MCYYIIQDIIASDFSDAFSLNSHFKEDKDTFSEFTKNHYRT